MAKTGTKIKKYRSIRNLTQDELGKMIGLGGDRVRQYELGIRSPKEEILGRLAKALNVPTYKLKGCEIPSFEVAEEFLADIINEYGIDFVKEYIEKVNNDEVEKY